MTTFVLGFMFRGTEVALVRKTHPPAQAGRLNGVGGVVHHGRETPSTAMVREFAEEAGVRTVEKDWRWFANIRAPWGVVICYATRVPPGTGLGPAGTEPVAWWPNAVSQDPEWGGPIMPDLMWLLPAAWLALGNDQVPVIEAGGGA